MLVTLEQANAELRLDIDLDASPPDPRLAEVERKVEQASAIILDYLKLDPNASPPDVTWDVNASPPNPAPEVVQAAVLYVLVRLYDDRMGEKDYLEDGVVPRLLRRFRDPALA